MMLKVSLAVPISFCSEEAVKGTGRRDRVRGNSTSSAGGVGGGGKERRRTAWPLLRGWISRNARTLSDSNSLKEGMSPRGFHSVSPLYCPVAPCHVLPPLWPDFRSVKRDVSLEGLSLEQEWLDLLYL
jgi:hypothetical protein